MAVAPTARATVTVTADAVLPAKFPDPAYTAVTLSVPTGNAVVLRVAMPPFSVPTPRDVVPV